MNSPTPIDRQSVYDRITNEIIAAIEAGPGEFRMPWHHDGATTSRPLNVASGKPYRGVNILSLWAAGAGLGFSSGLWGTYRQWSDRGAQVRKGEKGTSVVFWKRLDDDSNATGRTSPDTENSQKGRLVARGYIVFNADQVEGFTLTSAVFPDLASRICQAERFLSALGISIIHGGDEAYYRPAADQVHLPDFERFFNASAYYAVALHECGHATGAKHRLDRDLTARFGTDCYAMEEMCVELAAGFLLADLGISHNPRPDHAAYINAWLEVLKGDSRAIFSAASKAQAIADWMWARQDFLPGSDDMIAEPMKQEG